MKEKTVFITSALPYANGPLHLGSMVEHTQSDIYARFLRMMGKKVVYVCADDTHGTPIELNAAKLGKTPEQFIKEWHKNHSEDLSGYNISYDSFYSTNSKESKYFTEKIFKILKEKGHIYKKEMELMYDEEAKRFLPDRFVKGICPKCGSPDQYGDNCEKCGATYNPTELLEAYSVITKSKPVRKNSEHYFFRLSNFSKQLKKYLMENKKLQPEIKNQILTWVNEGLEDWCISRNAPYFGFKIPEEEELYFYVWLDAPIGYMASLAHYFKDDVKKAEKYWNDSEIIHFIGKDIIYFHLLFWPAVLMASGFTIPDNVVVHGFLNINGQKMSKSRGTFITAENYRNQANTELIRYYFASNLTHTMTDIDLDFEKFKAKSNNELVSNIANLIYRTLSFTNNNYDSKLSKVRDSMLLKDIRAKTEEIKKAYETFNYRDAVKYIQEIASLGNKYFQNNEPWTLIKKNKEETQKVLTDCANIAKILAIVLKPIIPDFSSNVEKQLGLKDLKWEDIHKNTQNHKIGKAEIVLRKVEKLELSVGTKKPSKPTVEKDQNAFSKLNLKVAKILSVSEHLKADKLLLINIDLGNDDRRQLVAGLKPYYPDTKELIGKHIIVVSNLEHANLRGEMSQGMMLAAETDDSKTVKALEAPKSKPGDQVYIKGIESCKTTIKFDDFLKAKIYVQNNSVMFEGREIQTDKEKIKSEIKKGRVR